MGFNAHKGFRRRAVVLASCIAALAGCATDPAPVEERSLGAGDANDPVRSMPQLEGTYRVVRGDTLYAIAFKRGLDYRDVAGWNGIAPPYTILVGQTLRLAPPAGAARTAVAATASAAAPGMATPGAGPSARAAKPVVADVATTATAPAPRGSNGAMFEDVPSQFSPPSQAQNDAAPATGAATARKPPAAAIAPLEGEPDDRGAPPTKLAGVQPVPAGSETLAPAAPAPVAVARPALPQPEVVPPAKPSGDAATANVSGVAWRWPGAGKMLGGFVGGDQTKQGIDIAGNAGDPVNAAADGEVVYSGNGLIGYGELIIVKHNASFLSAYGHNRKRLVQEGEKVRAGQQIAEMGSSASSRDELHFEIRRNGKPVNPLDYLPAR
jgi:lipoprotein NlpD